MPVRAKKARPGMRLKLGASVLAAARAVDTRPVDVGLRRFDRAHRDYVDAHRRVDAMQAAIASARARVQELHAVQNDAVERLAAALYLDGHPRKNPFTAFTASSPSEIGRLAVSDGADAIERLAAGVVRWRGVSDHSIQAAEAAVAAARAVVEAVADIDTTEDAARDLRATRDAIGREWDSALRALRSRTRAAADDGAPELYPTLFPPTRRRARQQKMGAGGIKDR